MVTSSPAVKAITRRTGKKWSLVRPSKQRSRYKKKAKGDNDDVDERFHGRYLHRQWEAGQHSGVNERNPDFATATAPCCEATD
jgi:hypothetical protein